MTTEPKVAIFYDWLNQWGGAERVLLNILKIFPDSPVYTIIYDPKKTKWLPKKNKIYPSILNKFSISKKNNIFYTPFYAIALEQFDFSQYDIVISTTQVSGHCLLTSPKTLFICYLHNINRYTYQTPPQFKYLKPLLNLYKKVDFIYGQRPDYLLCNSNTVKQRILDNYQRQSSVVYPGVNISFFTPSQTSIENKYFLVVSRLVKHKKVDLAIKACHKLNQKLIIVGRGRDKKDLVKLKNKLKDPNIIFLGKVSNHKLKYLYQHCQALICPQIEDFGLTPLEAQACGKPVIALKKGGITETVINGKTGLFFKYQTIKSLTKTIKKFNPKNFSSTDCVTNATIFSTSNFMLNFRQTINNLWQQHQTTIL
ncbi:MAG: glycosyltransferase [Candidatus Shapirobacteria bacterium]|jgi:glycosyltransferase involved in cell wall biosynthesis